MTTKNDVSLTQMAEEILNKISNSIKKTFTGLISVSREFQKCIASNPSNQSMEGPSLILENQPKLAVVASTALPCPICWDFMQYIFEILEAC